MFTSFETKGYSIVVFITISPNYRVNLQVTSKQLNDDKTIRTNKFRMKFNFPLCNRDL